MEKYCINCNIKSRLNWKQTTFPPIFSLIERAFSIFRQKMEGPIPSEMDKKVPTPAEIFPKLVKLEQKYKMHDFKTEKNVEKKIFINLVLTSSIIVTLRPSLLFGNEENLVALLVQSSFRRSSD